MTDQRTYQGHTYERSGPGQPWALVGGGEPASGQTSVMVPRVTPANPGYRATPEGGETPIHGGPADPTRPGGPQDPETQLSGPGIDLLADQWLMTRELPPLGMSGSNGARQRILNRAAQMAAAASHGAGDLVTQAANYRTLRTALGNQQTQLANIQSQERTASANLAALSQASHAMPGQTETRLVNSGVHAAQGASGLVPGHTAEAAYNVAYQTAINEYARLISMGSSGNGQLTDAARAEAQRMIPYGSGPDALDAAIAQAHIDMGNRRSSYEQTVAHLQAQLAGQPDPQILAHASGVIGRAGMISGNAPTPGAPPPGGSPDQFQQQAQQLFDHGATREQMDAFAHSQGRPPFGPLLDEGIRHRALGDRRVVIAPDPAQSAPPTAQPGSFNDSYLAQGMSGVNEGIANTLGAPVDLMNAVYGLGLHGINAVANTNFQPSDHPLLGSGMFRDMLGATGSIAPPSTSGGQQFVRRTGQSVGGALIPVMGTAGNMARAGTGMLTALGGGIGAATAQQAAPGNRYAELAAETLGSIGSAGGMYGLARREAGQAAEAAVPSVAQLRQQAGDLYTAAESRGIVAGPGVTNNIATRIRDIARNEELVTPTGRVSADYPRAAGAMHLLDDYAGQPMNPLQIQRVRSTLSDAVGATDGNERRIASMMLRAFDEETTPLAPELAQARDVSSRYLQAGQVQQAIDLAEPRAAQFSQSGPQNALRTEFRNLDRRDIMGQDQHSQVVSDAIQRVSRGDVSTNLMRNVGRLAPTGPISGAASVGVPFLIGNAIGGPAVGAAASVASTGLGVAARLAATRATVNQARIAELLARNGGEIVPAVDPDAAYRIATGLMTPTLDATRQASQPY